MAVLYMYETPNASIDVYDRVSEQIADEGLADGVVAHFACRREGGGMLVIEVWETEEAHDEFDAILNERIRRAGGAGRAEPRKLPVHNMMFAEETASIY